MQFDRPNSINSLLVEMGLPECEDGVLCSSVACEHQSVRISINGSLAAGQLAGLGFALDRLSWAGEPQRLLKNECQLK